MDCTRGDNARLCAGAHGAGTSSLLKGANGVACNVVETTSSQQFSCAVAAMAAVMNSNATSDPTKAATMLAIFNAQDVTGVTILIMKADGTMDMEMVGHALGFRI